MAGPVKPVTKNGKPVSMRVVPYTDKGRVLLNKDTRQSKGNDPDHANPESLEHFLSMLNINLQDRIKSRKPQIGGMFGGTNPRVSHKIPVKKPMVVVQERNKK